jgi:hypothetical protein
MPTLRKLDNLMETFAQTDDSGMDERRRLEEWSPPGRPATAAEKGLIAQAIVALGEIARCQRIVGVLRAERERRADIRLEETLDDDVRYYERMLREDARTACVGLKRSATGVRYLIARWERLERLLAGEGTWLGADRIEAIQLQGYSADLDQIYYSETAYQTWLDCLAAQADPKQRDIDLICQPDVVPKEVQDRGRPLWAPNRAASQARLKALVERELPSLRALEVQRRTRYEEPSRAVAKDLALSPVPKDEAELHKALRNHEASYRQAVLALDRLARSSATAARAAAVRACANTPTTGPREARAYLVTLPPSTSTRSRPFSRATPRRRGPAPKGRHEPSSGTPRRCRDF